MFDSNSKLGLTEHPLRGILAKLARTSDPDASIELCYLHRGAPNDQVTMRISGISKLAKGWFGLPDGETQIPYHRVIWVRDAATGRTYWEKRYPKPASIQSH